MTDRLKRSATTSPGSGLASVPGPVSGSGSGSGPGPGSGPAYGPVSSPCPFPSPGPGPGRDQTLSTIDPAALQAAAPPLKEEEYEGLRMKSSSFVLLERHRRKRITQSCSTLRQLLPTIPSGRVDMATVLETTVAFLETVQEVVAAQDQHIQVQNTRK
ncbi:spermatogenesis- and oogenesis-specific basic helix-loop-helix-containing protein 1-like [Etheostoma cragini]|uniref:spermatogenesis- and oogenesis-specific basic helix-loop-helix-containing protein 1-like n=1 Tax=Etheostoma cragini TaxID=417921 RepID=UPI00155E0D79|nr:spermatogenesis- and oogenesis-specific basic helix-loop-helix-containing protein 1-like [Etheostoma cragini]